MNELTALLLLLAVGLNLVALYQARLNRQRVKQTIEMVNENIEKMGELAKEIEAEIERQKGLT